MKPLLNDEEMNRAREAIAAIGRDLLATDHPELGPTLAGDAGAALAHAAIERIIPGQGHVERAGVLVDRAIDALAESALTPSLYSGFTGVAWVVEHLTGSRGEVGAGDSNEAIDEALLEVLAEPPDPEEVYDLIQGMVGISVYAFERMPLDSAKAILARIVEKLNGTRVERSGGWGWWSSPDWVPEQYRGDRTAPYFDLGVAHGVPGIAVMLAHAVEHGIAGGEARNLLEGATKFVLAHRLSALGDATYRDSEFPSMVGPSITTSGARTAWCYGDPGIAYSLFVAARALGDAKLEADAIALALAASNRDLKTGHVYDAALCHGAFGLAQVYFRLGNASGDERVMDVARRFFREGLSMRKEGEGVGGFRAMTATQEWEDDRSFLTGASGIALALSTVFGVDPSWDRLLLLS